MTRQADLRARVPEPAKRAIKAAQRGWARTTAPLRVLPDFLVIGGQRCGTTSLYRYLGEHPAITTVPLGKGAHFFDTNFDKGVDWYRSYFPVALHRKAVARWNGRSVTGEASPYYIFHPLVPVRVAALLPGVKIIALLRDPVVRAHSHHTHEVARGFETLSFEDAIAREPERLAGEEERMRADPLYRSFSHQHHSYLARGRYAEQLERWREVVPEERMLVLSSERFFADPGETYATVLGFLGVAPHSLRTYDTFNPRRYDAMSPATEAELRAYFEEPNTRLYELLGTDFGW